MRWVKSARRNVPGDPGLGRILSRAEFWRGWGKSGAPSPQQPDREQGADDDGEAGGDDDVEEEATRGGEAGKLASATRPAGALVHLYSASLHEMKIG